MDNIYDVENMTDEEAESKAHTLGWRPKDEYNGNPENYTDAKTFLSKANENIPMMRENYRKVEAQNAKLQEQLDNLSKQVSLTSQRFEEAERRGYERAVKEIEEQQRAAAISGDLDRYDELAKRKADLIINPQNATAQINKNQDTMTMEDQIALAVFQSQNPWFRQDAELNEDMSSFVLGLKSRNPNMAMSEILEKAKAKVVKANPDKFADGRKINDVLTSGGTTSAKLSYTALPEKAIYDNIWNKMERSMRLKGMSDADIEKQKRNYQANCLNNK
jgi:predicted  nucleic acid-binding Zn-ribbon protein